MFTFDLYSPEPSRKNCPFDECEDAKPLCKTRDGEKLSVFGVFDGVGNSLRQLNKGHKSSYLGSNETRRIFEEISSDNDLDQIFNKEEDEIKVIFEERLFNSLLQYAIDEDLFNDLPKELKGPYRLLTTTAAVAFCRKTFSENHEVNSVDVVCIWAGDSRCYILDRNGLHQLTKDDQETDSDAYESIIKQPPLSNSIKISRERENANERLFHLNCRKYRFNDRNNPFFILCSTDGCYDHVDSPMHFEKALLDSILESIKPLGSQDIETILKSNININADDCTLSAGFFSFNENVNDKKLIESVYSQRQKYIDNLIDFPELQPIISRGDEIIKEQHNIESEINVYRNLFSEYISTPKVRARLEKKYSAITEQSSDKSLDYLLKNGGIEKNLPEDFNDYSALLSKKDQLSKKLSETKEEYASKLKEYKQNLRKIWYDDYKEGYERIYNHARWQEETTQDETNSSDDDSVSKNGAFKQNDGGKTEEATPNKSKSFRDDSGRNNGKSKQSDGGKAEETPKGSNSSHEYSGNNKGASKQNDGGNAEETTLKKTKSSNENLGGNSDRSAQNSGEKPETGQTVSSQDSETWTCQWCGSTISAKDYPDVCPFCSRREGYPPPQPPITWTCRECGLNFLEKNHPDKCPVCGADRYRRKVDIWTCERCGNTISVKDHPHVCPNCGYIKWANQNPLEIICNIFLSGFYKIRHIILKIANLILKTESKKSNDDKGGY